MNQDNTGCGGNCTCGAASDSASAEALTAGINGIRFTADDETGLRELAHAELLRQRAVELGYLAATETSVAPEIDESMRQAIEDMLDAEVPEQEPNDDECRRHYDANRAQFTVDQALRMRHILFAVTSGVDVQKLIRRAEDALLEVSSNTASPERFAQLAAELSNCPSGAQGGELGWVEPHELSPELAKELFLKPETGMAKGLQPRLIQSRFGLHIIDVCEQREGRLPAFDEVKAQIASRLTLRSRATALGQYMRLLAGAAEVTGISLDAETSALVQ